MDGLTGLLKFATAGLAVLTVLPIGVTILIRVYSETVRDLPSIFSIDASDNSGGWGLRSDHVLQRTFGRTDRGDGDHDRPPSPQALFTQGGSQWSVKLF